MYEDISNDEEKSSLILDCEKRISKAVDLQFMINTEGWKILLDTFENMKDQQLSELYKQSPGNDHDVLAAHSVWFTTVHVLNQIRTAVEAAIRDGEQAKFELQNMNRFEQEQYDEIP